MKFSIDLDPQGDAGVLLVGAFFGAALLAIILTVCGVFHR